MESEVTQSSRTQNAMLSELLQHVRQRTGGAIRDLTVNAVDDALVLSGVTTRFYRKQQATAAVRERAPDRLLRNDIVVRPR